MATVWVNKLLEYLRTSGKSFLKYLLIRPTSTSLILFLAPRRGQESLDHKKVSYEFSFRYNFINVLSHDLANSTKAPNHQHINSSQEKTNPLKLSDSVTIELVFNILAPALTETNSLTVFIPSQNPVGFRRRTNYIIIRFGTLGRSVMATLLARDEIFGHTVHGDSSVSFC